MMTSVTIRDIDEAVEARLRLRAARYGRSIEDEALDILRVALGTGESPGNIYEAIRARVEPFGGFELETPPRDPMLEPMRFDA